MRRLLLLGSILVLPAGCESEQKAAPAAAPVLQEMGAEGLVAMTDVEVLHHISGKWESKKMNKLNRSDNEH